MDEITQQILLNRLRIISPYFEARTNQISGRKIRYGKPGGSIHYLNVRYDSWRLFKISFDVGGNWLGGIRCDRLDGMFKYLIHTIEKYENGKFS